MSQQPASQATIDETRNLAGQIGQQDLTDASHLLQEQDPAAAARALFALQPFQASRLLEQLPERAREEIIAAADTDHAEQWKLNRSFPEDSVGRMMSRPFGVFPPDATVAEATEEIRSLVKRAFVTYLFVTAEASGQLMGVVTMRDILLADKAAKLSSIMLKNPFSIKATMPLVDAMKSVLNRHFPVYPVCDDSGRLVGLLRGQDMFEAQAFELSAQAGSMVGVEKEERLFTPWPRSLKFRHPWLQLNLLTAFVAAAVVGFFQDIVDQVVVLAVFLPVLAGQSGNTGCQALAVALRGITLGELKPGRERALVLKEAWLGLLNGVLVGITAGAGMAFYAYKQGRPDFLLLGFIVMIAMSISCVISGLSGALIPLCLKKLGADPATASSIFLTTATDVASMGAFLGLATLFIQ